MASIPPVVCKARCGGEMCSLELGLLGVDFAVGPLLGPLFLSTREEE